MAPGDGNDVTFAVPSKLDPPIVRAVWRAVAVPALPLIVVWSPVLLPLIELVPVTASVGVELPDITTELTDVGVIAPRVRLIAGVVVGFATEPLTPFAVVTETVVTVPPVPVADSVPPENATPDPIVTLLNPPALLP